MFGWMYVRVCVYICTHMYVCVSVRMPGLKKFKHLYLKNHLADRTPFLCGGKAEVSVF